MILQDASLDLAATWSSISLATGVTRSLEASREALRTAGAWLETGAAAELADERRADVLASLAGYADSHLLQLLRTGSAASEAVEVTAWRQRLPDLLSRPWRLSLTPQSGRT